MVHCPQCGAANPETSQRCRECGSALPTSRAGLRCPMCSHSNPPGRETCEKCGARLVPLVASSPSSDRDLSEPAPSDTPLSPSESEREAASQQPPSAPAETDWLRQMRESAFPETQDQIQELEPEPESEEPEADRPDWLRQMRESAFPETQDQTQELEPEPESEEPEADRPDWLQRLAAPEGTKNEEPESSQPPSWLRRLESPAEPSSVPAASPPSSAAEEEEEQDLDWLDRVEPSAERAGPVEEDLGVPVPAAEGDIPDWLAELTDFDADEADEESSPGEEQIPDWFKEIDSESLDMGSVEGQEIPDWLAELTAPEQTPSEEAEAPELLAEPEEEPGISESVAPADEIEPFPVQEEEEVPDWLREMESVRAELEAEDASGSETLADEEPTQPAPAPEEEEVPDWLEEIEPATTEPEQELPDWAHTMASAEKVDLPDWMAELAPEEEQGEAALPQESPAPDWLSALESAEESIEPEEQDRSAVEPAVPTRQEELPAWLTELAPSEETEAAFAGAAEPPEEEADSGRLADLEPAEVPEWLIESAPSVTGPAKEELPVEDLEPSAEGIEVPDWLKQAFAAEEGPQATEAYAPGLETEDLAQAEIPAWLEAMRPDVEPGQPSPEEETLETSGLLAGIPGVVPPAAEIVAPPTAPPKPEVLGAEAALARARLWQELIARTTQPAPIPLPQAKTSGARDRVLRWLLYAVLLAGILTPMFADVDLSGIFATDKPLAPESVATFDLIEQTVTQGSQVLVAFDYDPSFLGELQLQAGILLQQLARKGARIIALSLTPEGAGLAQQLTEDILPGYGYEPGPDYVNLGYLPGEAIGIRSLVLLGGQLSDRAFSGQNLEGTLVRSSGEPLVLRDMALIVLLTGNPNDLRWWVEQITVVKQDLGQTPPLVAGVSAAIAPLARPYYLTSPRQIDGLLVGLTGAADYELLLNVTNGPAHARLGGKLVGQLVVFVLLVLGILVYSLPRRGEGSEQSGR